MRQLIPLAAVVVAVAALNPRIAFDAGRPLYAISCSTGISIHWAKLLSGSGGLFGVYSLDGAARTAAADQLSSPISTLEMTAMAKSMLMKPCR